MAMVGINDDYAECKMEYLDEQGQLAQELFQ
jgi:hypothetical protein